MKNSNSLRDAYCLCLHESLLMTKGIAQLTVHYTRSVSMMFYLWFLIPIALGLYRTKSHPSPLDPSVCVDLCSLLILEMTDWEFHSNSTLASVIGYFQVQQRYSTCGWYFFRQRTFYVWNCLCVTIIYELWSPSQVDFVGQSSFQLSESTASYVLYNLVNVFSPASVPSIDFLTVSSSTAFISHSCRKICDTQITLLFIIGFNGRSAVLILSETVIGPSLDPWNPLGISL